MELLTMGEASRRLRVHAHTILRWERAGLIVPIRDSAGRRLFTGAQIADLVDARNRDGRGQRPD